MWTISKWLYARFVCCILSMIHCTTCQGSDAAGGEAPPAALRRDPRGHAEAGSSGLSLFVLLLLLTDVFLLLLSYYYYYHFCTAPRPSRPRRSWEFRPFGLWSHIHITLWLWWCLLFKELICCCSNICSTNWFVQKLGVQAPLPPATTSMISIISITTTSITNMVISHNDMLLLRVMSYWHMLHAEAGSSGLTWAVIVTPVSPPERVTQASRRTILSLKDVLQTAVDFRNFIVFFRAETLAHWNPTSCQKKHPQSICSDLRLSNWKFEDWNYGNRPCYFVAQGCSTVSFQNVTFVFAA